MTHYNPFPRRCQSGSERTLKGSVVTNTPDNSYEFTVYLCKNDKKLHTIFYLTRISVRAIMRAVFLNVKSAHAGACSERPLIRGCMASRTARSKFPDRSFCNPARLPGDWLSAYLNSASMKTSVVDSPMNYFSCILRNVMSRGNLLPMRFQRVRKREIMRYSKICFSEEVKE